MPRSRHSRTMGKQLSRQRDHIDHVRAGAVEHLAVVGGSDFGLVDGGRGQALLIEVRHADEPHLGLVGNHLEVAGAVIAGADHRRLEGGHCASSLFEWVVLKSH